MEFKVFVVQSKKPKISVDRGKRIRFSYLATKSYFLPMTNGKDIGIKFVDTKVPYSFFVTKNKQCSCTYLIEEWELYNREYQLKYDKENDIWIILR